MHGMNKHTHTIEKREEKNHCTIMRNTQIKIHTAVKYKKSHAIDDVEHVLVNGFF